MPLQSVQKHLKISKYSVNSHSTLPQVVFQKSRKIIEKSSETKRSQLRKNVHDLILTRF